MFELEYVQLLNENINHSLHTTNASPRRPITPLVDVDTQPDFLPGLPELVCPIEYIEPPHEGGFFIDTSNAEKQRISEIYYLFFFLIHDEAMPQLDKRMQDHVDRVVIFAEGIARALGEDITEYTGLSPQLAKLILKSGAKLHDKGKSTWGEELLDINAKISREQYDRYVKPHPEDGVEIIREIARRQGVEEHWAVLEALNITLGHHLKWDPDTCPRKGYPEKAGQQTFLTSIVAVADSFDSMFFRPYSNKYHDLDACIDEVLACMKTGEFNPQLRNAFIQWAEENREDLLAQCNEYALRELRQAA